MASPLRRPEHNNLQKLCMNRIKSANPITVGLLLYIAMFQWTAHYHWHYLSTPSENHGVDSIVGSSVVSQEKGVSRLYAHLKNDQIVTPIQPWKPYSEPKQIANLKVQLPVFMTSLSKSGTTSVWKYFKCGGIKSAHQYITKRGNKKATLLGECMEQNVLHDRPPFEGCGDNDVFTDSGYLKYDHDTGEQCYYPSIEALDRIYGHYPNATFINVIRDRSAWYESLKGWSKASLFVRMRLCNATKFPNGQTTMEGWKDFYDWHNAMVRQFAVDHPSLNYIEVKLEDENLANVMESNVGIEADCWKNCKPQNPYCEGDKQK